MTVEEMKRLPPSMRTVVGSEDDDEIVVAPKRANREIKPVYKSIREHMLEKAVALNGYPYVTVSRIVKLDKDWETDKFGWSTTTRKLMAGYIHSGRGDVDEFIKAFEGAGIGLIVAFPRMPTMAKDGTYNGFDIHGEPMPFINVDEVPLANRDEFQPFMVIRDGRDENGKMKFNELRGNPYPTFSPAIAKELTKVIQGVDDTGAPIKKDDQASPTV